MQRGGVSKMKTKARKTMTNMSFLILLLTLPFEAFTSKKVNFKSLSSINSFLTASEQSIENEKTFLRARESFLNLRETINNSGENHVSKKTYNKVLGLQIILNDMSADFFSKSKSTCLSNIKQRRNALLLSSKRLEKDDDTEKILKIATTVCNKI